MTTPFDVRPVREDQLETFQQTLGIPFGQDPIPSLDERFRKVFERDRLRAAFEGDRMISTFGAFSLELNVPGGRLPMAGTTLVTVLPTHRRRGVLRRMMAEHFRELHERGTEPLAGLWSAEFPIYGRYGYGAACERAMVKIEKPYAVFREPPEPTGTMRLVDFDEAVEKFPAVHDRVIGDFPGTIVRPDRWWSHRVLDDPEPYRGGATSHRRVLFERDGEPAGYLVYRTKEADGLHWMELNLLDFFGVDEAAQRELWQFVFGIDLVGTIRRWNQPVDDPLFWWLVEPRRLERKIDDTLWVRLVELPVALEGRRYSRPGSLVLEVTDEFCPWNAGRHRLDVNDEGVATCRPTTDASDIALDVSTLGSTYLGGHRFTDLARAGLVRGDLDALARADAMFSWHRRPWCQQLF